jgi:hypothetical protein
MNERHKETDILGIEFQYYLGGNYAVHPQSQKTTLMQFLLDLIDPNSHQAKHSIKIKQAKYAGDEALRTKLKSQSKFYTPAAIATYRNLKSIISYTGFIPIDFDKDGIDYQKCKADVFSHPSVIASWFSVSGKVHALVWAQQATSVEEYHSLFWGLYNEFPDFDIMMQTPIQPFYYSHDPDALIKAEAVERWMGKALHPKVDWKPPQNKWLPPIKSANHKQRMIYDWMQKQADKIVDAGHPQIRAIAFTLGGYAATGYFTENAAIEFADHLIECNAYLSLKPDTYKKTVRSAIKKGMQSPLRLKIDE